MRRIDFLAISALLIAAGLSLRLVPWGFPLAIHHFGGGLLWGAMVYALIAMLRPKAWTGSACLFAAVTVICVVESSRLIHTTAFDQFRSTLAGQLLSGRIFSPWNMVVDAIGAAIAAVATSHLLR